MLSNQTTVKTERASGFLQQLCKHFGHKAEVEFTPKIGSIGFEFGKCDLQADDDVLSLVVSAEDQPQLERMQSVIGGHLERFAFREELKVIWP